MSTLTVGLTGGIASGKSQLAAALLEIGAPVIDGDDIARQVVAPGSVALEEIYETFGPEYRQGDGALDRRRMRERVFANEPDRRKLESITHPHIRQGLIDWRNAQTAPYCVLAVPILVESGMDSLVDRVLVVDTSESLQMQRLCSRDGITEELARGMLAAQASRSQRLERADDVFKNVGALDAIPAAASKLHAFYLDLAARGDVRASGLNLP